MSISRIKNSIILRTRLPNLATSGATPIELVKIAPNPRSSRGTLPRLLYGFQALYLEKPLLNAIFELLEQELLSDKKATGRPGMSLWEILVLGVVRVGNQLSYVELLDLANNHQALRGILGLGGLDNEFREQTLNDNVHLLTEDILLKVNTLLVSCGNELLKKTILKLRS